MDGSRVKVLEFRAGQEDRGEADGIGVGVGVVGYVWTLRL